MKKGLCFFMMMVMFLGIGSIGGNADDTMGEQEKLITALNGAWEIGEFDVYDDRNHNKLITYEIMYAEGKEQSEVFSFGEKVAVSVVHHALSEKYAITSPKFEEEENLKRIGDYYHIPAMGAGSPAVSCQPKESLPVSGNHYCVIYTEYVDATGAIYEDANKVWTFEQTRKYSQYRNGEGYAVYKIEDGKYKIIEHSGSLQLIDISELETRLNNKYGEEPENSNESSNPVRVTINGSTVSFPDQQPLLFNNRTYIPVRFVAEGLGAQVSWEAENEAVFITRDDVYMVMQIGSPYLYVGKGENENRSDDSIMMDVEPIMMNGRTMIPIRYVAEALGCTVNWNESTNTVEILDD